MPEPAPTLVRRLLVPGLSTLAMLAVLLFLGTWQVERLSWKRGLIAAIAAAELQPAKPISGEPAPFAKLRAEGVLDPAHWALFGAEVRILRGASVGGARLLGLLLREGEPAILVDRGWVPVPTPAIASGRVTIEGYARPGEHAGMFAATDDRVGRRFFTLNPQVIGRALGAEIVAPFVLVALGPAPAALFPDPARALPRPANNHLAYAATWYGLAGVLLVIFVLHVRKVLRP